MTIKLLPRSFEYLTRNIFFVYKKESLELPSFFVFLLSLLRILKNNAFVSHFISWILHLQEDEEVYSRYFSLLMFFAIVICQW